MATKARNAKSKAKISSELSKNNPGVSEAPKRLILFVHGIRDPGFWEEDLCKLFEGHGFKAESIGYGVYDAFRFLFGFRRKPVATVKQQIVTALADPANEGSEVTIIAHSFGTYIVTRILDDDPNVKISRLVMCGGIVRQTFRWDKVSRLNAQRQKQKIQIINENSARDIWPIMARHATYGFGDSGATGCADKVDVQNRLHDIPHSAYLDLEFARQFWIPPIVHGEDLKHPKISTRRPWYFFLTRSPFRAVSAVFLGLAAAAAFFAADRVGYRTAGSYEFPKKENISFEIAGFSETYNQWPEYMYSAPHFDSPFKRRIFSDSRFDKVVVKVLNRPLFQCETEAASESVNSRTPLEENAEGDTDAALSNIISIASAMRRGELGHRQGIERLSSITANEARKNFAETKYTFDFSNAYRTFGLSQMEFEYRLDAKVDNQAADKLILKTGERIVSGGIRVLSVEHDDRETCLNIPVVDFKSPFVEIKDIPKTTAGWWSWLISFAHAEDASQTITQTDIRELLGSPDPASRGIAVQSIVAAPQTYAETVKNIIMNPASSPETVADAIRASRNALPAPLQLDADVLIGLAHGGPPLVRDAARSYLRAPGVVSRDLARRFSGADFEKKVKKLSTVMVNGSERRYFQDYLLLITARDVFYNLGLFELAGYVEKIRRGEKASFDDILAPFEAGMKLPSLTHVYEEKVALAKNSYGKALAMFVSTINLEAAVKAGKMSFLQYIEQQKGSSKPLEDKAAAQQIIDQFNGFLAEVKGREDLYPWPFHIAQARRCADSLTFACLDSEVQKAQ